MSTEALMACDLALLRRDRKMLREALAGAIEVWDRHYAKMPRNPAAEDDEFGAMNRARSAMSMTEGER